jgi:archaetidylinositol phosphate synthase
MDHAWDLIAAALIALVLLTMLVFAWRGRGRPSDPDVMRRPATLLLGRWVRDWLMWIIAPLERLIVRSRIGPDLLSYCAAVLALGTGWLFAVGWLTLAACAVLLGGVVDTLDGRVARARGMASSYGSFLDATLDRFAESFMYLGIAFYLAGSPWAVLIVVSGITGSLLVSYTLARGEAHGVKCEGGVMLRAERLVVLALAALLDAPLTSRLGWQNGRVLTAGIAVIGLGTFGTAVYQAVHIARALAIGRAGTSDQR